MSREQIKAGFTDPGSNVFSSGAFEAAYPYRMVIHVLLLVRRELNASAKVIDPVQHAQTGLCRYCLHL